MPYENTLRLAQEAKVLAELATDPAVKQHLMSAADALQDAAEQILTARGLAPSSQTSESDRIISPASSPHRSSP